MLKDITLGQYFPGNSAVHALDPRTKIAGALGCILIIFLLESAASYGVFLVFLAVLILSAQLPFGLVLRSLKPLWPILLLTVLIHAFSGQGETLAAWGPFAVTDGGLQQGGRMAGRLALLIVSSSLLTFTTSPIALTDGLEALLRPAKRWGLPAHELAMMMTIALRFIPTLLEETQRIIKAQEARGVDFSSGSLLRRGKNLVPVLVPLFISAFRRADELATAMEARCYRGGEGRTRMHPLQYRRQDAVAALFLLLFALLLVWLRWGMQP